VPTRTVPLRKRSTDARTSNMRPSSVVGAGIPPRRRMPTVCRRPLARCISPWMASALRWASGSAVAPMWRLRGCPQPPRNLQRFVDGPRWRDCAGIVSASIVTCAESPRSITGPPPLSQSSHVVRSSGRVSLPVGADCAISRHGQRLLTSRLDVAYARTMLAVFFLK
jgi:hypothetical protein